MATWMLDQDTGDLAESGGRPVHITGKEEVGQRIMVNLRWFAREWFRDRSSGVDWYKYGLGQRNPDLILLKSIIGLTIRKTTGVLNLASLTVSLSAARVLSITAKVQVDDSDGSTLNLTLSLSPIPTPTPETPQDGPAAPAEGAVLLSQGITVDAEASLEPGVADAPTITII